MQNALKYILNQIFVSIPQPILIEAFIPKGIPNISTLDFYINDQIITGRILDSCNLYGGKKKSFVLKAEYLESVIPPDNYSTLLGMVDVGVYRVPPEVREHRHIAHAISLDYPYAASGLTNINYPTTLSPGVTAGDQAYDVIASHTMENVYNPPRPVLISGDMISLEPRQVNHIDWVCTVLLEYDAQFTNLNPSAIKAIADLSVCATKAYIYNKLVVDLDRAFIVGGQELTTIRDIVLTYENENERFDELLLKVRGSVTSDSEIIISMVQMMI